MARDRFMPRQFSSRGDRLAFSNGIIILAVLSALLLVVFHAETHALIPLYAIGVFVSFTLSQLGMVRFWFRERGPRWPMRAVLNGAGAVTTGIVALIIATTKFTHGAWLVILLIPLLVLLLVTIRRHYDDVAGQLSLEGLEPQELPPGRSSRPRPGRRRPPRRAGSGPVRPGHVPDRASGLHRGRCREQAEAGAALGQVGEQHASGGPSITLSLRDRPAARVRGSPPAGGSGHADHHRPARVRARPLVAAAPPQPDGLADQGRHAVPPGRHRDRCALSPCGEEPGGPTARVHGPPVASATREPRETPSARLQA